MNNERLVCILMERRIPVFSTILVVIIIIYNVEIDLRLLKKKNVCQ